MGCLCVGSNTIKINPYLPNKKIKEPYFDEEDREFQKLQKEIEENILIIISRSHSINSIRDTSGEDDVLEYYSIISNLEN